MFFDASVKESMQPHKSLDPFAIDTISQLVNAHRHPTDAVERSQRVLLARQSAVLTANQ